MGAPHPLLLACHKTAHIQCGAPSQRTATIRDGASTTLLRRGENYLSYTKDKNRANGDTLTVLCHWKNSSLCDHAAASEIAVRASFFASLPTFPLHGVPAPISELYYAENWEDMEGFIPYTIFDVSEAFPVWREAVKSLFLAEHAPYFHYLRYYEALSY